LGPAPRPRGAGPNCVGRAPLGPVHKQAGAPPVPFHIGRDKTDLTITVELLASLALQPYILAKEHHSKDAPHANAGP